MPDVRLTSVVELGEGSDHVAYEVNSKLIFRVAKEQDPDLRAELTRREAMLLDAIRDLHPPDTPNPRFVIGEAGLIAYPRIAGMPLIEVQPGPPTGHFAAVMGGYLSRLHTMPIELTSRLVPHEKSPISEWLADARQKFAKVEDEVPAPYRAEISAFLEATPPDEHFAACLCHNDLGIEHILFDPGRATVTGIIDWSDAAITDPARDLALVYRDLGPNALEATLDHYKTDSGRDHVRERALFYARCSVVDDVEYGLRTGRGIYLDKSLAALPWLFPV